MTHVVEHKSFRYTWELVRHTYLVDLGNEIDIQLVGISPALQPCILPPPSPRTSFFEVEIDQIQKGGKTVFSFRNICPVELSQKPDWNPFHLAKKSGNTRITRRFQAQDGNKEIRWLYTDDFFLISLSSGDRHDLEMLISLTMGKLNMIALSIQSGKRIRSEFENQQKYRDDLSVMFSAGVDGAFRDVPVYQQHGEMTESDIDVSAALMSAEMQDLNASVASAWGTAEEPDPAVTVPPEPVVHAGIIPAEGAETGSTDASGPDPGECAADEGVLAAGGPAADSIAVQGAAAGDAGRDITGTENAPVPDAIQSQESTPLGEVLARMQATAKTPDDMIPAVPPDAESVPEGVSEEPGMPAGQMCAGCGAEIPGTKKFCGNCGAAVGMIPPAAEERIPAGQTCTGCGAEIPGTKKFCGNCGTAVGVLPPAGEAAIPEGRKCKSCGAELPGTKKFCGNCGAAAGGSPVPPEECSPARSGTDAAGGSDRFSARARPAERQSAVNLKAIEDLEDLSWLND
jgi:hypothetical protein